MKLSSTFNYGISCNGGLSWSSLLSSVHGRFVKFYVIKLKKYSSTSRKKCKKKHCMENTTYTILVIDKIQNQKIFALWKLKLGGFDKDLVPSPKIAKQSQILACYHCPICLFKSTKDTRTTHNGGYDRVIVVMMNIYC